MTPQREALDDTIDRVGAKLTAVPADPTLARRITARLNSAPRSTLGWPLVLAMTGTAAAAMVAGFILTAPTSSAIDDESKAGAVSLPAPSPEIGASVTAMPPPNTPIRDRGRLAPVVRRANVTEPLPELRQIDALSSPAVLAVEDLSTDSLTVAPVDVTPLYLADLIVGDVSGREEPKE
jgi:hypothetical protein